MRKPILLLAALVQIATLARANIVELTGFRLMPLVLAKKQDFTYGTGLTDDDDIQAIRFDLRLMPQNTIRDKSYGLMMIAADQVTSNRLVGILTNGTVGDNPRGVGIRRKELTSLDDVEELLGPIKKDLAVYETVIFSGASPVPTVYNQTFSIPSEGVFSTFFLFGKHRPFDEESEEDKVDDISQFIDDIFGEDDPSKHNRQLAGGTLQAMNTFDTSKPHLLIQGQISYVNSFGFLNTDQYPLLQFYLVMFFIYAVGVFYWVRLMRKHDENKVSLHYYFLGLLLVTCIECAITFLEYDVYNQSGKRVMPLTVFSVFFSAFRETLARLMCLLISLGYGIVMNVLNRYRTKIGLLSFLFFIASSINLAGFYINQHKPLSISIKFTMALPQFCLDVIFIMWIVNALIRTLSYLRLKRQEFKLSMMKKFAGIFTVGVTIIVIIRAVKIFVIVFNEDQDSWSNEHKFVIAWFITYTITLVGEAYVFRPQDGAKMIAEVDELLDETLTEIGAIEGDINRLDSVEYATQIDQRMREREQQLTSNVNFKFQQVPGQTTTDMFKHIDRVDDGEGGAGTKQIEFAIEEEEKEDDENMKDLDKE